MTFGWSSRYPIRFLAKVSSNKVGASLKPCVKCVQVNCWVTLVPDQCIQKQTLIDLAEPLGGWRKHVLGPRLSTRCTLGSKGSAGLGIRNSQMQSNNSPHDFPEVLDWPVILGPRFLYWEQWCFPGRSLPGRYKVHGTRCKVQESYYFLI